jgi:hypothetical protein
MFAFPAGSFVLVRRVCGVRRVTLRLLRAFAKRRPLWAASRCCRHLFRETVPPSLALRGLPRGAKGIRTDGHRGRSEISSYSSLRQSMLAACSRPAPSRPRSTPSPRLLSSGSARRRRGGRLVKRWIEVDATATPPTPQGFSRECRFADCVSAVTPLLSIVELLIARLGRDDPDLGGRGSTTRPSLRPRRRASWMTFRLYTAT